MRLLPQQRAQQSLFAIAAPLALVTIALAMSRGAGAQSSSHPVGSQPASPTPVRSWARWPITRFLDRDAQDALARFATPDDQLRRHLRGRVGVEAYAWTGNANLQARVLMPCGRVLSASNPRDCGLTLHDAVVRGIGPIRIDLPANAPTGHYTICMMAGPAMAVGRVAGVRIAATGVGTNRPWSITAAAGTHSEAAHNGTTTAVVSARETCSEGFPDAWNFEKTE